MLGSRGKLSSMQLIEKKIIEQIHKEGPLPFHDFMEMALYDPDKGYYTSPREKTGSKGDYYTSPWLGGIFGAMIAKQVEEVWRIVGEQSFVIIEYGAGSGALCFDILCYRKNNVPLYDGLTYYIIEKSPAMREKEKNRLADFTGSNQISIFQCSLYFKNFVWALYVCFFHCKHQCLSVAFVVSVMMFKVVRNV
jgi:SAM-dependent MidA family methyltransferase